MECKEDYKTCVVDELMRLATALKSTQDAGQARAICSAIHNLSDDIARVFLEIAGIAGGAPDEVLESEFVRERLAVLLERSIQEAAVLLGGGGDGQGDS